MARLRRWIAARVAGPEIAELRGLRAQFDELAARHHLVDHEFTELSERHHRISEHADAYADNPFLTWQPPGHFYSAIPDLADVSEEVLQERAGDPAVPGVDLRPEAQLALFDELAPLIDIDLVFGDGPSRFHQPNGSFDAFDAAVCSAMVRHARPARIVEVGSGFSSALMLDVAERHGLAMTLTCVEPYPEVLLGLLDEGDDEDRVRVLDIAVQDAGDEVFATLEAGDVLFIDSTHVAKAGSDVVDLFGRVLPAVAPGVLVHIHDVFHPFEYPMQWIAEGRAWSEVYLVRALLAGGSDFEVVFFNNWFGRFHRNRIADERLASSAVYSGSLWLRRRVSG